MTLAHPCYPLYMTSIMAEAKLGDEVALRADAALAPVGLVTAIYAEAVEVSTGDDYKVADLVLIKRASA
jgi:hypothetical protein